MKHTMIPDGTGLRCTTCSARWNAEPRSACPGIPLYRTWKDVPATLATRTMMDRDGLRLPRGARPVAVVENGHHARYWLFPREVGLPRCARTAAQQAAFQRARAQRGQCQKCGASPGDDLIRRRDYRRFKDEIAEDRLCRECYCERWRACRNQVLSERRAFYRGLLPHLAVCDFETTGLRRPSAIEVAVWGRAGLLFHALIDPGVDAAWEPDASRVHGLHPADVAGHASWSEVEAQLLAALKASEITHLGSWGSFDKDVVWLERARRGESVGWPVTWINIMDLHDIELCRQPPYWRGWEPHGSPRMTSLFKACRRFQVPPGTHRAETDARAAFAVLEALLVEPSPPPAAPASPDLGARDG